MGRKPNTTLEIVCQVCGKKQEPTEIKNGYELYSTSVKCECGGEFKLTLFDKNGVKLTK